MTEHQRCWWMKPGLRKIPELLEDERRDSESGRKLRNGRRKNCLDCLGILGSFNEIPSHCIYIIYLQTACNYDLALRIFSNKQ
jgi:hypothetical protein